MKRRTFLRHSFHAMAVPGVLGSMGFPLPGQRSMESLLRQAAETDKVLVMIYLDGGNDGLNTVIPLNRLSALNTLRPQVVLDESDILSLKQSDVGLHPSLSDLRELYDESRFQIIQNVGYPQQNFSHFRSTDIWMSGSGSDEIVSTGWMGRHLEQEFPDYPEAYPNNDMEDPLSVEIGFGSSLLFQGIVSSTSITVDSVESFYQLVDNVEQDAPDTPAGEKLKYLRLISRQSQEYGQRIIDVAGSVNNHVSYPEENYLADQLKIVSKLIAGGSRTPIYLVRLHGFDTHDTQVESDHSTGWHAYLLQLLNDGISAFMKDLEFQGVEEKVLGMTFSEFGRTILSNGSNGTDHGSAAPMFLFGNAVRGGVLGTNPVIDSTMDYSDNLQHEYDFRQIYGSILEQWFGLGSGMRNNVLLDDFETVEIIGSPAVTLGIEDKLSRTFTVYPNPLNGHRSTIQFEGDGTSTSIKLINIQGKTVQDIFRGNPKPGLNQVSWNTQRLNPGRYFVVLRSENQNQVFSVVK